MTLLLTFCAYQAAYSRFGLISVVGQAMGEKGGGTASYSLLSITNRLAHNHEFVPDLFQNEVSAGKRMEKKIKHRRATQTKVTRDGIS